MGMGTEWNQENGRGIAYSVKGVPFVFYLIFLFIGVFLEEQPKLKKNEAGGVGTLALVGLPESIIAVLAFSIYPFAGIIYLML